jgi:hypothetical protein
MAVTHIHMGEGRGTYHKEAVLWKEEEEDLHVPCAP